MTGSDPSGAFPGWAGAVLAGGASKRMGRDKASLHGISGERLLDRACDLLSGLCASVMAVGTNLPLPSGIRRVEDPPGIPPSPVRGILGALEESRQPNVLFLPVDLPGMTLEILESIQSETGPHFESPVVAISPMGPEPLVSAWPVSMAGPLRELVEEGSQEGFEEMVEGGYQEAAEQGLSNLSVENDFYKYVKLNWIGRVYIRSDYYNQPKVKEKMLLVCKTKYEVFYFSILMEEKIKTASLIDHKSLFNASYPTLPEQELVVLKDEDEFKVMSILPEAGRYPKHYFTIFNNQRFNYDKRLSGTESPGVIINKAFRGSDQNNNCYKGTKKGLFRIKQ